jgi:hypothetical protein
MKSIYPLSETLSKAIESLFPDPSMAMGTLGAGRDLADDLLDLPILSTLPSLERARVLRTKLENFVVNMAEENDEMDSPETAEALRMQAIGLLIALRELALHFPELNQ